MTTKDVLMHHLTAFGNNDLEEMLKDPAAAIRMGKAGATLVRENYTLDAMASRLKTALAPYIEAV